MDKDSCILVTGARGLVGSALQKELTKQGFHNVVAPSSQECDLTNFKQTLSLFEQSRPEYVFHAAAAVYGIMGNMENKRRSYLENTLINVHVIESAMRVGIKKIVAMGTGCIYPFPPPAYPLKEDMVWQGKPHYSEDSYAHAKRSMLAQLSAYKESDGLQFAFVISTNLYGPHDKFDIAHGHVVPSLIRKFYEAKNNGGKVSVWGNGSAQRDFIYSEDVGRALLAIMDRVDGSVNMASGKVCTIKEVVDILAAHTQMQDNVVWDNAMPNGQDHRSYDLSVLDSIGFKPSISLEQGLKNTYDWYAKNAEQARKC